MSGRALSCGFLELRVLDAGVHFDGRRADVTRTEAHLRVFLVSLVKLAIQRWWRFLARPRLRSQRSRVAHGYSLAFEGCLRPGHFAAGVLEGCARGPVYLRRCTFTARASADARLPPFIDLSAALKSIAVFVFHSADSRLSTYRCAPSGS